MGEEDYKGSAMRRRWRQSGLQPEIAATLQPGTRFFWLDVEDGQIRVFVSPPTGPQGWHLSISHVGRLVDPFSGRPIPGRIPTWEEIRDARYDLVPDSHTMAMILPPMSEYVNFHATTMHLREIPSGLASK